MELDDLAAFIKESRLDEAVSLVQEIGNAKLTDTVPMLIECLYNTESNALRNAVAIALSDIGASEAIAPIIKAIKDPKTDGDRGTLLYALESFDVTEHVDLFVELLFDDAFEVSRQSFLLLEKIVRELPTEVVTYHRQHIEERILNMQEKLDFLAEALDLFDR